MIGARAGAWIAVAAFATAFACSPAEEGPPVAAVSVTLPRASVPLGGPLEMRYAFDVVEGVTFDDDWRVFVHFLDVNGELQWTDDHMPPMPTSTWMAGTRIEYERTVFMPDQFSTGPVAVVVGLVNPATGQRARLAGVSEGLREYLVARFDARPASEALLVVPDEGWYQVEGVGGTERDWRWSSGLATMRFANPRQDATLYLDLDQPIDLPAPQRVEIRLGDELIDAFDATPNTRWLRRLPIDVDRLTGNEDVRIEVRVDPIFVPAELGTTAATDTRELGVRMLAAFLLPDS